MNRSFLALCLFLAACSADPSMQDAGRDAGRPPVDAGVDAGMNRCATPTGAFMGCRTPCDVCVEDLAGFPLYGVHHPQCVLTGCALPTRQACPMACPAPAATDVGVSAVFFDGGTFDAGPAVSGVLDGGFQTTLLRMPPGTRFVTVRPKNEIANCQPAVLTGLLLMFRPQQDGGAVTPGVFPISGAFEPPPGSVVARLDTTTLGTSGSVNLTAVGATTSGTYQIQLTGSAGMDASVSGAFDAEDCAVP
ncbi:MAG: hypothetical protein JNM17_27945 [Archangium sp.]|nr:hypothetical protein [Archangium sp.]